MARIGPLGIDVRLMGGEVGKLVLADGMTGRAEEFWLNFLVGTVNSAAGMRATPLGWKMVPWTLPNSWVLYLR